MKVLIDTNVLLDVLLARAQFVDVAQQIWSLAERQCIDAAITTVSVTNTFYIVEKFGSKTKAYQAVEALVDIFKVVAVDARMIATVVTARPTDFEDGLQAACAAATRMQYIVTRDPKGFRASAVPTIAPAEVLALVDQK